MAKKGEAYTCPRKVARKPADIAALGSAGNHIWDQIQAYIRNRPDHRERAPGERAAVKRSFRRGGRKGKPQKKVKQ